MLHFHYLQVSSNLFNLNKRKTGKRCEICSNLTIKTPERRQRRRSGVFIVNFEYISQIFLAFLSLTSSRKMFVGYLLSGEHLIRSRYLTI